jgi:hypothetical protein
MGDIPITKAINLNLFMLAPTKTFSDFNDLKIDNNNQVKYSQTS